MKYPSREYSELVERKQNEIRGNVSSVKLTPQECEEEIKAVTGGAFEMSLAEGGTLEAGAGLHNNPQANSFAKQPKRRGRPKGSRNRPKT